MGLCMNCGGALENKWKFCIFCGAPVSTAPTIEPAPEPARVPDADADAEPADELVAEPDRGPDAGPVADTDTEPDAAPEPARPPIPAAIRTFVPVEIPNEDADVPTTSEIRPRFRARRVDVPLVLGIALGVAGIGLIVYIVAVLSGQG